MNQRKDALIDILKEKYEYENERKRYYDNVINLPISLLAFIITGIYFIVTESNQTTWFNTAKPFIIFPLLFSSVISMFFLFRVFFKRKRKYSSFPSSETVFDDYQKLLNWHIINSAQGNNNSFNEDFDDFIIEWYRKCNKNNTTVNDERAADFHASKMFIGLSYALGIMVFIMFCAIKINPAQQPEKSLKVEIIGQKENKPLKH
ncbi:hypothetical protein [Pedobacter endophyticus]|uniref:Uncharacterized protein n=1 Tax=Pedobacter endophyticus TaxID=2789740 RepID=A0A7S9L173_9SPHI|nr:hypothetical protein [Pedobacter endophyticus]QPH40528.1 hypothetical protein IZT61_04405 [Pedobacter endophyticus]